MSTFQLQPCVDLDLSKKELQDLIDKAKDWAIMHGINMRSKQNFNKSQVQIAPFALLPSSFPKKCFERAKNIQVLLNEIMHKVAHDDNFIRHTLKGTIEVDDFTARLFNIYETVYEEGFAQDISLGLFRSDYLLHNGIDKEIKQVELNTIASSFAGLSTIITEYHRYILMELGHADKLEFLPLNNPVIGLCKGLTQAWSLYNDNRAVILIVVEDITYNISDQRFHEFEIRKLNPAIKVIRRSLNTLVLDAQLGSNKELIVDNLVVAVVYFRSGYELQAYPTEKEWAVRLLIERSKAIKCPSIQYHLAGTKKIQQALVEPNVLNMFIKEPSSVAKLQEIFTGLYSLDFNVEAEEIITKAIQEPEKYVLKPQREGGGNNLYNENVKTYLTKMRNSKERTAWILMDRINPPSQKNYLISPNDINYQLSDVISELGIYGVIIGNHTDILYNEEAGHILRTKMSTENEGGIIAGVGVLDSPYLVT
ncbi:glutathione synthetase-like [Vespa velutina]|uniref:glutathione synthetase-like n=1 Tax=Vespa velutina TaxID=202808 RepID=UPI001FB23B0A|nr:glutathione synthetase-like [Vespa velutina]